MKYPVAVEQPADDKTRTERQSAGMPLGGGSADDLTGTFEGIAVNKKNTDGSSQGYRFASTINWNEGTYSWHLGN